MSRMKTIAALSAGAFLFVMSLMAGPKIYSPAELWNMLVLGADERARSVIMGLRLPRILMALGVGASLSVSGAVFQAILKNPLADPYLIGVSSGAACGAAAAIVLGLGYFWVAAFSFAGSLGVITGVFLISRRMKLGGSSLILSGVSLGFILSSAVLMIFFLAGPGKVHQAVMWMMGDFSAARYDMLAYMGAFCALLIAFVALYARHLDVISMGDLYAQNLGVTPASVRALFWAAALLASICVSLCGVIGFVGLIIPHAVRKAVGPGHSSLVPWAAAAGGVFLMAADAVGRSVVRPYDVPVGIITGFAGGIFFLLFVARGREYR